MDPRQPPDDDEIRVDCYCGYRGDQEPRRFLIGDQWVEVVEIVDRWCGPDHRSFKLLGNDGRIHLLRHDIRCQRWERT